LRGQKLKKQERKLFKPTWHQSVYYSVYTSWEAWQKERNRQKTERQMQQVAENNWVIIIYKVSKPDVGMEKRENST